MAIAVLGFVMVSAYIFGFSNNSSKGGRRPIKRIRKKRT